MDDNGERLILIVGHYKSGSTWLANLLCLHPEIRGLQETHVFRHSHQSEDAGSDACIKKLFTSVAWAEGGLRNLLRNRLARWSRPLRVRFGLARGQSTLSCEDRPTTLLDLSVWNQMRLKARLRRCSSPEDFCRCFFGFLFDTLRPPRYLMEKTPTNIDFVPTIRSIFPAARIVAVYRDGRDVVVSDKYHVANTYGDTTRFSRSALKWRSAMEHHIRYAGEYGVLDLSYESLLERAEETVSRLLAALELRREPELVRDMIERSSFEFVTGRTRGVGNERDFYRKGVARDWLNHFSEDDMKCFSELAGDLLVKLGYESSADWRTWVAERPHAC